MPAVLMFLTSGLLGSPNQRMATRAYSITGICSSVLYAIALVFLLLAVLAGRSKSNLLDLPPARPQ
jgi:hypothetical protein